MTSRSSLDYQKRQKVGLDDLSPQKCFSAMFSLDAIIDNMYFNPGGSMARRINWQKLRKRSYYKTIELASTLGVSRSTIKYWSHNGLSPIDRKQFSWIYYGGDVIDYIKLKNKKFKVPTNPGEVYCFHCRKSRRVKTDSLKIVNTKKTLGNKVIDQLNILGNCIVCGYKCGRLTSENCIESFLIYYPEFTGDVPVNSNS